MGEIFYPRYRHNGTESVLVKNYEEEQALEARGKGPWFDAPSFAWKWHAEQKAKKEKGEALDEAPKLADKPKEEPPVIKEEVKTELPTPNEKFYVDGDSVSFQCPACKTHHTASAKRWKWNGSKTKPTLNPSVNVNFNDASKRCHFFIENGKIRYCNDCFHSMKGKTVELPDWS